MICYLSQYIFLNREYIFANIDLCYSHRVIEFNKNSLIPFKFVLWLLVECIYVILVLHGELHQLFSNR